MALSGLYLSHWSVLSEEVAHLWQIDWNVVSFVSSAFFSFFLFRCAGDFPPDVEAALSEPFSSSLTAVWSKPESADNKPVCPWPCHSSSTNSIYQISGFCNCLYRMSQMLPCMIDFCSVKSLLRWQHVTHSKRKYVFFVKRTEFFVEASSLIWTTQHLCVWAACLLDLTNKREEHVISVQWRGTHLSEQISI